MTKLLDGFQFLILLPCNKYTNRQRQVPLRVKPSDYSSQLIQDSLVEVLTSQGRADPHTHGYRCQHLPIHRRPCTPPDSLRSQLTGLSRSSLCAIGLGLCRYWYRPAPRRLLLGSYLPGMARMVSLAASPTSTPERMVSLSQLPSRAVLMAFRKRCRGQDGEGWRTNVTTQITWGFGLHQVCLRKSMRRMESLAATSLVLKAGTMCPGGRPMR